MPCRIWRDSSSCPRLNAEVNGIVLTADAANKGFRKVVQLRGGYFGDRDHDCMNQENIGQENRSMLVSAAVSITAYL